MSLAEPLVLDIPAPPQRARRQLFKRLADVVCLPSNRVNAFERAMTGDLLVEMLREADLADRVRVSRRLAGLTEVPASLVRVLLRDDIEAARPLLEGSNALTDADLLRCIRESTEAHRRAVASRRAVGEVVSEALVEAGERPVIELLLRNPGSRLSQWAMDSVVARSRDEGEYVGLLLKRPELRPSQAYVMFWWSDAACRRIILTRFAVSREVLQEASSDVFGMAAEEGWSDPLSRKALQFIERRQRNRAAIAKSPFDSLDAAVEAARAGMTRTLAQEISYLAGVKPMTGAKLFTDQGGEPLAILCKATGLPRQALRDLWTGLRRRDTAPDGGVDPALERALICYDSIAVDRAQTVLRYWNWALSSALTPQLIEAIRQGDEGGVDGDSTPQRAAMLALGSDFGR